METIKKYISNTIKFLFWDESYFTGRPGRGEVLIQVWMQSDKK